MGEFLGYLMVALSLVGAVIYALDWLGFTGPPRDVTSGHRICEECPFSIRPGERTVHHKNGGVMHLRCR